jgi:DeoR/GlpR family transcriptional regulator of sugar metabolism
MKHRGPGRPVAWLDRRLAMAALIQDQVEISVNDLARAFSVSAVTVRKDLLSLQAAGLVLRTRGHAVLAGVDRPEAAFEQRLHAHRTEKRAIARCAADLVHDGDIIAIDASTTGLYLARVLVRRPWTQLRVVTNGLRTASEFAAAPGIEVFLTAGRVRGGTLSLVQPGTQQRLEMVSVDTSFVGAVGFTIESGLFEATHDEARAKETMIEDSRAVVAIVDSSKLGRRGPVPFCPVDRLSLVLSDSGAAPVFVALLERMKVAVRLAYGSGEADEPDLSASAVRMVAHGVHPTTEPGREVGR